VRVFASESPRAVAVAQALAARPLTAALVEPDDAPLCVVLGGDGTMLRAVQKHGDSPVYLGVNCGRLGFLMNDLPGDAEQVADQLSRVLAEGRWDAPDFPRLAMEAMDAQGRRHQARALNDVYVERELGQTCHLRVTVDGVEVVERMVCDGVIVATALGSTAYSFSAGGPAAHPRLRALHLTAICPHSPRLPPLLLPEASEVCVEVLDGERRPARAVADGVAFEGVRTVTVRGGADSVRIGFVEHHDFVGTLVRKVLRGG
jgi:NAD+ kinase